MGEDLRSRLDALGRAYTGDDGSPHELRTLPDGRYTEFRPVGEGGMGLIYWAIDTDLNREVAFKVIRSDTKDGSSTVAPKRPTELRPPEGGTAASQSFRTSTHRFLQEAWITSGMAHPGIVPVYELGKTPEGVPYYTMRFIRGERTLATALEEAKGEHLDERLALLEPFLKVCDTLRYAHARSVIHRDLKPSNIALGDFGEVILLDWGLAKLKGEADVDAEDRMQAHIRAYRESTDLQTVASGMGTPGYMSPEAALGQGDAMDESSDVYSLGAMLFEILTGRLPFEFSSYGELASKLLRVEPQRARDVDNLVPEPLSDLCASCLSRVKDDRPRNADEVARAVRRWQVERERDREIADLLRDARAALAAAEDSSGAARVRHLDRAVAAYGRIFVRRSDHAQALSLQAAVKQLRERGVREREQEARRRLLKRVAAASLVVATAITILVAVLLQGKRRAAEEARARESTQRARAEDLAMFMLGDLRDDLAPVGRLLVLKKVAEKAIAYYESLPSETWTPADRRARGLGLTNIGEVLTSTGDYAESERVLGEARVIFDGLVLEDAEPADHRAWERDLTIVLNLLGDVRQERGDLPGAQRFYEAALATRRHLLEGAGEELLAQDDVARTLDRVGDVLSRRGDRDAAMRFFQESLGIRARLADADPADERWQHALSRSLQAIGDTYSKMGMLPDAREKFEEVLRIREARHEDDASNSQRQEELAAIQFRIAHVHAVSGEPDQALAFFEQSLRSYRSLGERDPSHAWWQRNIALALERVAHLALADGDLESARRHYQEALVITRGVARRDPSSVRARHDYASALVNAGNITLRAGEHAEAIENYREAVRVSEAIIAQDPDNAEWLDDVARAHGQLAAALAAQGEAEEAEAELRRALKVSRKLVTMDSSNADYLRNFADHLRKLGDFVRDSGDLEEGRSCYEEARDVLLALVERDPERMGWRTAYVSLLNRICDVVGKLGDDEAFLANHLEALKANRYILEHRPHDGERLRELSFTLYSIGMVYLEAGRLDEALPRLREALTVHRDAALRAPHWLKEHRFWTEAYQRVVKEAGPEGLETSGDHLAYAYVLHSERKFGEAVRSYEVALTDAEIRGDFQLGHLYNAACAAALGGQPALALEWLSEDLKRRRESVAEEALQAHLEHARVNDPDLASLRDLAEFKALFD